MKKIFFCMLVVMVFFVSCGKTNIESLCKEYDVKYYTEQEISELAEKAKNGDKGSFAELKKNQEIWSKITMNIVEKTKKQNDVAEKYLKLWVETISNIPRKTRSQLTLELLNIKF